MGDEDWIYGGPDMEEINRNKQKRAEFYNAGKEAQREEDLLRSYGSRGKGQWDDAYNAGKKAQREEDKRKSSEESGKARKKKRWPFRRKG